MSRGDFPYQRVYPLRALTGVGHGVDPATGRLLCGNRGEFLVDSGRGLCESDCGNCVRIARSRQDAAADGRRK